jgi:hypothetical protein
MRVEIDKGNYTVVAIFQTHSFGTRDAMNGLLDEAIALSERLDWLLKHDENAYQFGYFQLRIEVENGTLINEKAFWELVADSKEYDKKVVQYIDGLIRYATKREMGLWHDDENPAGTFAMNALILRDLPRTTHVRLYADFLKTNDMSHETYQRDIIERIFSRTLPWENDDVLYLFAVRLTSASGQWGLLLLEDPKMAYFTVALKKAQKEKKFLKIIEDEEFDQQKVALAPSRGRRFSLLGVSAVAAAMFANEPDESENWINQIATRAEKSGYIVDRNERHYSAKNISKNIQDGLKRIEEHQKSKNPN